MSDPDFFDGLILGSILLTGVFASVYVGFFLVPAFWILILCGWPAIIATLAGYEILRRYSRAEVMTGRTAPFSTPPIAKFCPACGTLLPAEATGCPMCGLRLLPRYDVRTPPPKFCLECGTDLREISRYRRGWCPTCQVYR